MEALENLNAELNATILMVTHDPFAAKLPSTNPLHSRWEYTLRTAPRGQQDLIL